MASSGFPSKPDAITSMLNRSRIARMSAGVDVGSTDKILATKQAVSGVAALVPPKG